MNWRLGLAVIVILAGCKDGSSPSDTGDSLPQFDESQNVGLPARLVAGERISCTIDRHYPTFSPDRGTLFARDFVVGPAGVLLRTVCHRIAGVGSPAFLLYRVTGQDVIAQRPHVEIVYLLGPTQGTFPDDPPNPIFDELRVIIPVDE